MMYRYLPYFLRYDTYLWRNKNKSCATTLLWQGNTSSEQLRLKISHQIVDRVDMVLQRGRPVEGQQTEAALEQVGGHKVPSHQVRLVITYNKSIYKSWQKLHLNRSHGGSQSARSSSETGDSQKTKTNEKWVHTKAKQQYCDCWCSLRLTMPFLRRKLLNFFFCHHKKIKCRSSRDPILKLKSCPSLTVGAASNCQLRLRRFDCKNYLIGTYISLVTKCYYQSIIQS